MTAYIDLLLLKQQKEYLSVQNILLEKMLFTNHNNIVIIQPVTLKANKRRIAKILN